eukprot:153563-Hanusia_phi.AAC.2
MEMMEMVMMMEMMMVVVVMMMMEMMMMTMMMMMMMMMLLMLLLLLLLLLFQLLVSLCIIIYSSFCVLPHQPWLPPRCLPPRASLVPSMLTLEQAAYDESVRLLHGEGGTEARELAAIVELNRAHCLLKLAR